LHNLVGVYKSLTRGFMGKVLRYGKVDRKDRSLVVGKEFSVGR